MTRFTGETWREATREKLGEIGSRMKSFGQSDLPYITYGAVAGLSVWPLVETAVNTGQLSSILGALYSTVAAVGTNLIATRIEAWKDSADRPTENDVIAWAAAEAGNADLRAELDVILERLEAIPAAIDALPQSEQPDFRARLLSEMAQLGNGPRFESVITGGGAFILGNASAARDLHAGAHIVHGHEIHDSTINGPVLGAGATLNQIIRDETRTDPAALRRAYLETVWRMSAYLSLGGVDPRAAADAETRLDLAAVYTALLTESPGDVAGSLEAAAMRERMGRERRRSAVAELDRRDRLVLLGDPGSGKSTFANFVALCMAGQSLNHPVTNIDLLTSPLPDDRGNDEDERQHWRHGALLPVAVVLRDLAAEGLPPAGAPAGAENLWDFLRRRLERESLGECVVYLQRELREVGGLVLFDGLDEVPEADSRRTQIKQIVESFAAAFPLCRILVTSRTYAYQNQEWRLAGFDEAVLAPFTEGQIRRFVGRWYGYIGRLKNLTAEDAQGRGQLLQGAIFGSDRLMGLAERPLLLTLMASLHAWRGGSLPEKREELYHDAVDLLLDWWESQRVRRNTRGEMVDVQPSLAEWLKVDRDRVRELLNRLAYEAHAAQADLVGTADIAEETLVTGLLAISENPDVKPKRLVDYLSHRAGLLVPRGVRIYTFPHRTFQEYLAACYLTDHDFPELPARLARGDLNRWREAVLLAAAKTARGSKPTVWLLADALCFREPGTSDAADANGALMAGQVLLEAADPGRASEANRPKVERVRRWQKTLLAHPSLVDFDRAVAGRALADLGDDRPEVMDVDAMQFCLVPGGDFLMGSDAGNAIERPLHPIKFLTTDYWMGRYPVTNAQYAAFVAAGGYDHAAYWEEAAEAGVWSNGQITGRYEPHPRSRPFDYGRPFTLPNHPVVGVTWYEALAFTRWLAERWRDREMIGRGWEVKLPSEAEWEKAARGGLAIPAVPVVRAAGNLRGVAAPAMTRNPDPDRVHPWTEFVGPRLANSAESAINGTSAAGLFPLGASPYGCEEMAGTVWEWTRSVNANYPYEPGGERENLRAGITEWRVLRGGAYYSDLGSCRCAQRDGFVPYARSDIYGFRALVAPS